MCTETVRRLRSQVGLSLLELIMVIVIVSVALVGVMSVFITTTKGSADPMARQQAQLIAEAYLEEILLKKFYDPDTNTVCTGTTGGETRATYDNVCDYNGISEAPASQLGAAFSGLSGYSVAVSVTSSATLNTVNNTGVIRVLRIDVTVTAPDGNSLTLSGYRTNYNCDAAGPTCISL